MSDIVKALEKVADSFGLKYVKKNILHVLRLETDALEKCKPKIFRKRIKLISEKTGLVHWKGGDDYVIKDL